MQAIQLLLSGRIDSKTAGLLLYALQTASLNLRQTDLEPCIHERVVIDPRSVDETPLGENSWDEEDFEEENDEEEEDSDDDDGSDDEGKKTTAMKWSTMTTGAVQATGSAEVLLERRQRGNRMFRFLRATIPTCPST